MLDRFEELPLPDQGDCQDRMGAYPRDYVVPPAGLGVPHADRAHIFMPFAALRGYYDLVRQQEKVEEPFRELTDEDALRLSDALAGMGKGDLVEVTWYSDGGYVKTTACVRQVDLALRRLSLVSASIPFDLISDVRLLCPEGE